MKTLYIVRHAKSSWDHDDLTDHDRPLMHKGEKKTARISKYLMEMDTKVDLMISSSAVRAYETAKLIAEFIAYPIEKIQIEKSLYHSDNEQIFELIYAVDNQYDSLMIFGHNPTFTSFANQFMVDKIDWIPTSGVISVDFSTDKWEDIVIAPKRLKFVVFPKMLK